MPEMAHVSMILGPDGKRLSKRHGDTSVIAYRDEGYLPDALVNYLTRLGWSFGDQEIFTREELVEKFTLDNVGKSAAVFNMEKLDWLNGWYIRNKPAEEIAAIVLPLLRERGINAEPGRKLEMIVKELGQRAKTLLDIADSIGYFYADEITFDEKAAEKFLTPETGGILKDLSERMASAEFTSDGLHAVFDKIMEDRGIKMGAIAQPVRVALTGGTISPGFSRLWRYWERKRF